MNETWDFVVRKSDLVENEPALDRLLANHDAGVGAPAGSLPSDRAMPNQIKSRIAPPPVATASTP